MKLLLVSYHFGPRGATGAFRWNAMVRDLAARGWEIDVITSSGRSDDASEQEYEFCTSVTVHVVRVRSLTRAAFDALQRSWWRLRRRSYAGSLAISEAPSTPVSSTVAPDSMKTQASIAKDVDGAILAMTELGWARSAARKGRALARNKTYAAVVVSTPPSFTQTAGERVARDIGIPYVADLRDPWVLDASPDRFDGRIAGRLAARLERRVLSHAHTVVCNTDRVRAAMERLKVAGPASLVTIRNGYDRLDGITRPDANRFRVVFSGWLYPTMKPRGLFEACGRLRAKHDLGPEQLEILFMGTDHEHNGTPLTRTAEEFGIGLHFHLLPRGTREEAWRLQMSAAVLPVLDLPYPYAVPMKFYDSVQFFGTMLLIGNPQSALEDVAHELGLQVLAANDIDRIFGVLDGAYTRWLARDYATPTDIQGVFDRRHQSALMDGLLRRIAGIATEGPEVGSS